MQRITENYDLVLTPAQGTINDLDGNLDWGIYAVGAGIFQWEGTRWRPISVPYLQRSLISVTVVAPDQVWAVGRNGTVVQFDGHTWHVQQVDALHYYDLIDVTAWSGEVWVTAAGSEVFRLRDRTWGTLTPPEFAAKRAQALWAAHPHQVFVEVHPEQTGTGSHIALWDGATWSITPVADNGYLRAIHGTGVHDVWAVGYRVKLFGKGGQAFHYDGAHWQRLALPVDVPWWDVHVSHPNEVWISGEKGVLLHGCDRTWQVVPCQYRDALRHVLPLSDGSLLLNVNGRRVVQFHPSG